MLRTLKYAGVIIAGGLYIWVIVLLLEDDNWIGISALTTMLLAIAAFWAIWQNRSLQIRERRERLLNEIIEWAIDVSKCGLEQDLSAFSNISSTDQVNIAIQIRRTQEILSFQAITRRSRYISEIVSIFGLDLKNTVKELREHLGEHIKLLDESADDIDDKSKVKKVIAHREPLNKATRKVIEEACKIKTKDIKI